MLPDFTLPDLTPVQQLGEVVLAFLPRIAAAILIFLAFYFINRIIQRVLHRYSGITRMPEEIAVLLRRTLSLVMNIIGIITALGTLGIDVSALIAGLGLTGFALGFALQDIISNFLAGVLLTIHRPFRRGNYIRGGG